MSTWWEPHCWKKRNSLRSRPPDSITYRVRNGHHEALILRLRLLGATRLKSSFDNNDEWVVPESLYHKLHPDAENDGNPEKRLVLWNDQAAGEELIWYLDTALLP